MAAILSLPQSMQPFLEHIYDVVGGGLIYEYTWIKWLYYFQVWS